MVTQKFLFEIYQQAAELYNITTADASKSMQMVCEDLQSIPDDVVNMAWIEWRNNAKRMFGAVEFAQIAKDMNSVMRFREKERNSEAGRAQAL